VDNFTAKQTIARYSIGDMNTDGRIDEEDLKVLLQENRRQAEWYQP
jgi:hypothetical protein